MSIPLCLWYVHSFEFASFPFQSVPPSESDGEIAIAMERRNETTECRSSTSSSSSAFRLFRSHSHSFAHSLLQSFVRNKWQSAASNHTLNVKRALLTLTHSQWDKRNEEKRKNKNAATIRGQRNCVNFVIFFKNVFLVLTKKKAKQIAEKIKNPINLFFGSRIEYFVVAWLLYTRVRLLCLCVCVHHWFGLCVPLQLRLILCWFE